MQNRFYDRIFRVLSNPSRIYPAIARRLRRLSLSKSLLYRILPHNEYKQYHDELLALPLIPSMNRELQNFNDITGSTTDGEYGSGVMSYEEGIALYALTRKLKPAIIVETGVCSGFSSALILQALHMNEHGHLYSVDFPELIGKEYEPDTFWEGKGNAVVPRGKASGWLIPEYLRHRWTLHLGKSQDVLPGLLQSLGSIDIFIHDSEHSYECMMFEYQRGFSALRSGGLLISDDIMWNTAFFDFAKQHSISAGHIAGSMGILVK